MMKQKVLFTASIAKHILRFHLPYLEWFQQKGYEVHVACNGEEEIPFADKVWRLPFVRSPFSFGHTKVYFQLKNILEQENYYLVHCHTPMASVVTRLAARKVRIKGTKVLYTAHGFHFFNGAGIMSWLTYYPAEVLLSSWADGIVTINREDFDRISRVGSKKTLYFQIPGIGVERRRFVPVDKEEKNRIRLRNGFQPDDFLLVFAAEFIHRKNHEFLVEAMAQLKTTSPEVKVLFCGRGELQDDIEQIAIRKGVKDAQVFFMGFRSDIHEMYQMADLGVSSSRQEGLGLNLIEEMMCGLPVLASFDRGHQEIVQDGVNGYLFQQNNFSDFKEKLHLLRDKNAYPNFSRQSMNSVQKFELSNSLKAMENIYHRIVSVK